MAKGGNLTTPPLYLLIMGASIFILGLLEIINPRKVYSTWAKWFHSKFFFLHGIFLIITGLPLTLYNGPLSTPVFIFGIFLCLIGPFMLLYPEKFRGMYSQMEQNLDAEDLHKMVYFDGALRIAAGGFLTAAFFLN